MNLTLQVKNQGNVVLAESTGVDSVTLVYKGEYQEGDTIILMTDTPRCFLITQLEDSMFPVFTFMKDKVHNMTVPFGELRLCYSPKSFSGGIHLLTARCAAGQEINAYKNVAVNPYDYHENLCLFPHSIANVETRGESVFASRNAIDGHLANAGHGTWPYQSWGINRNPDAELRLELGRMVLVDKAVLTTRADFPHDSWWTAATLIFSDNSSICFPLCKTDRPQVITFAPRKVDRITLCKLIKAGDESPFPALTQLEIWGTETEI